jgi:hypothetical protein
LIRTFRRRSGSDRRIAGVVPSKILLKSMINVNNTKSSLFEIGA